MHLANNSFCQFWLRLYNISIFWVIFFYNGKNWNGIHSSFLAQSFKPILVALYDSLWAIQGCF